MRPGVSLGVGVSSQNTGTGTIVPIPGTAQFNPGDSSNSTLSFQPASNCTTPCTTLLSVAQPNGFSTPAFGAQLNVTVNKPSVSLRMVQTLIGNNLEVPATGALDVPAPGDLTVTISSNSTNVLLSTSPTAMGTQSITVIVPNGSGVNASNFPFYYVQARASSGTAQLTASAPGFNPGSITVNLAPSGFVIIDSGGVGAGFGVQLVAGTTNVNLNPVLLDATGAPTQIVQQVAGGLAPSVTVSSDSSAVAVTSPVVISGGSSGVTLTWTLQSKGTANITLGTPTGFTTLTSGNPISVSVF